MAVWKMPNYGQLLHGIERHSRLKSAKERHKRGRMTDKSKSAKLIIGDIELDLPVYSPSAGPDVIDIRKLYSEGKTFTYDPGFTSTASCESTITFIRHVI